MHNLYKSLSIIITSHFIKNGIIDERKKEIYEYGFEILISKFVYAIFFIVTSLLTKTLLPSIIFWLSFSVVRTIAGGYHANTHLGCNILTILNHIVFICILKCIPDSFVVFAGVAMLLVSSIIIIIFAPIDHPNKPFIKTEKTRFRVLSCIYASIIMMVAVLLCVLNKSNLVNYLLGYAFGTLSAAISLVVAKIYFKKGKHNEKNQNCCC